MKASTETAVIVIGMITALIGAALVVCVCDRSDHPRNASRSELKAVSDVHIDAHVKVIGTP